MTSSNLKMMGKTESYDFVYKKTYGLESHPELTLTSRSSDLADTPFNTKTRYPICS